MQDTRTSPDAMFSSEDSPVRISRLPESVRDWLEAEADFGSSSIALSGNFAPVMSSSKTSLDFCHPIRGETLRRYLEDLPAGYQMFLTLNGVRQGLFEDTEETTTLRGECWTLNISESPSAAVESSLSQVLETEVAQKYFLSPKAASGILRRSSGRGRSLPETLQQALENVAGKTLKPD